MKSTTTRRLPAQKNIALVAHDHCKKELIQWCLQHQAQLAQHTLFATGTTGHLISLQTSLTPTNLLSGPMGGDQQLGAMIAEGKIDVLIFFWDPMSPAPHDPDVKALMRIATVWNIPMALNVASADYIIDSSALTCVNKIVIPDYTAYLKTRKE